jgi:ABC-type multidrug transport system fused ATPase/permease subunit
MEAVNALHGAKTLIIIAHRLTTVANCDLLYKLENGRVAQSGSFAEVVSE